MAREEMAGRRYRVHGLVLLGHAVLVMFFWRPDALTAVRLKENALSLLNLDLSMSAPRTNATLHPRAETKAHKTKKLPSAPDRTKADSATPLDSTVSSSNSLPQSGSDWYHQAEQVADSQAESIFKEFKRKCDEAALRGENRPGCRKYQKPDAWVPQPKKFGLAGGLPYVRLGKRCILGLGFFACGVGKQPEAEGHALDGVRDPDRPNSSVPDRSE